MSAAFELGPNETCLCGSGRKWRKCHDPNSGIAKPEEVDLLTTDPRVDPLLSALTMSALKCLDEVARVKIDRDDRDRRLQQICFSFYAQRIYRVTLAGATLIRYDQGVEAFALRREQYYAWLALHYYALKPDEAVLFVASMPISQLKKALEVTAFDDRVRDDPERRRQLEALSFEVQQAYADFPKLKRPKGKSGNTSNPIMIDWQEPRPIEMIRVLAESWVREEAQANGEALTDQEFKERLDKRAREADFFHSDFPSQDKHGTAFAVKTALRFEPDLSVAAPQISTDDPNALFFLYIPSVLNAINTLVTFNSLRNYEQRFTNLVEAFKRQQKRYNVDEDGRAN